MLAWVARVCMGQGLMHTARVSRLLRCTVRMLISLDSHWIHTWNTINSSKWLLHTTHHVAYVTHIQLLTKLVARLLYASPAWWGFLDAEGKRRLQATLHKLQQSELLPRDFPTFGELCQLNDQTLFQAVLHTENHVLYHLLPPIKNSNYNLRTRPHNRTIPSADSQQRRNFIIRMLYHNIC